MIDYKAELKKLTAQNIDEAFLDCKTGIAAICRSLENNIEKIRKKQGEMGIQLEEIYSLAALDNENEPAVSDIEIKTEELKKENNKLLTALVFAADTVEDFYRYYEDNRDDVMSVQSSAMWRTLCKALAAAGAVRIADENTPFNAQLNTIENVVSNPELEHGCIVKVLKSGYIYNNAVVRKSSVSVNKINEE